MYVAKPNLGLASAVKLKGNDAASGTFRILQIHTWLTVDECPNVITCGDDFVPVPISELHVVFIGLVPEQNPTVLFVQFSPPARTDIGLVNELRAMSSVVRDPAVAQAGERSYTRPELWWLAFLWRIVFDVANGFFDSVFGVQVDAARFDVPRCGSLAVTVPAVGQWM